MAAIVIILGSESDKKIVGESKMLDVLDEVGVSWEVSVISAHRNPNELKQYCRRKAKEGTLVFIGIAGMAAALPGAIATYTKARVPVIGVPLVSDVFDGMDALMAMVRMPPGMPVAVCGVGESGPYNAALLACQIVALADKTAHKSFRKFLAKNKKLAQIAIMSSKKPARQEYEKIAEGKTKIIWAVPDTNEVLIENKDDITAGDGAKRDVMTDKGILATETTCNCFKLLHARGILTHFIERVDERTFRARRVHMIPIELVARRIASGSYLKRDPSIAEGTRFETLVIEFFLKDDSRHDPLAIWNLGKNCFELYDAKKPLAEGYLGDLPRNTAHAPQRWEEINQLRSITVRTFLVLEAAWAKQGVVLVDLKIECGFDVETDALVVADVIDNDSWRIWPGADKARMKDKQVYRDLNTVTPEALTAIQKNYAWVAEATKKFVKENSHAL